MPTLRWAVVAPVPDRAAAGGTIEFAEGETSMLATLALTFGKLALFGVVVAFQIQGKF